MCNSRNIPATKNLRKPPIKRSLTCSSNICRSQPCLPKRICSFGQGRKAKSILLQAKLEGGWMPSVLGKKWDAKTNVMPDVWSTNQGSLLTKLWYVLRKYLISVSWYKRKRRQRHLQSQVFLVISAVEEICSSSQENKYDGTWKFPEPHQSQPQGTG